MKINYLAVATCVVINTGLSGYSVFANAWMNKHGITTGQVEGNAYVATTIAALAAGQYIKNIIFCLKFFFFLSA